MDSNLESLIKEIRDNVYQNGTSEIYELSQVIRPIVEGHKKLGDDFEGTLSDLRGDKTHFVYEILQNAEDEEASYVKFELFDDKLEIEHNGKEFRLEDVIGVLKVGNSKKLNDRNKAGEHGIGFKSVFAVTKSPIIHSGKYHFRINDFQLPEERNPIQLEGTKFIIEFNRQEKGSETFELIKSRLESIDSTSLLFLNKIEKIQWKIGETEGVYSKKSSKKIKSKGNVWKITIESNKSEKSYLLFEDLVIIGKNRLFVKIAYERKGKNLVPIDHEHFLYVFFPTDRKTHLNFLVHAPFRTTKARDNISFDSDENLKLIEAIAELVCASIETIRDMGKLSVEFFKDILPLEEWHNKEIIYETIYKKVEKLIGEKKVLPSSEKGKFVSANDAVLATKELVDLFSKPKDRKILFDKSYFLDPKINQKDTLKLYDYFQQYRLTWKVKKVGINEVIKKIDSEILKEKSDKWLIRLYALFHKEGYKTDLRSKPILRTECGDHIAAFSNGNASVYLPTDVISDYPTVKRNLYKNKKAKDFFEWLELRKPKLLDEIEKFIIPKYNNENLEIEHETYIRDFEKIMKAESSLSLNEKSKLEEALKSTKFIKSYNPKTKSFLFCRPEEIYFQEKELLELFANNEKVFFVDELFYNKFDKNKIDEFLENCGVKRELKIISDLNKIDDKDKNKLSDNWYEARQSKDKYYLPLRFQKMLEKSGANQIHSFEDYNLDQCDWILNSKHTQEFSFLLWNQLLILVKKFGKKLFDGKYSWHYVKPKSKSFDAIFIILLRESCWIAGKDNKLVAPSKIFLDELHSEYDTKSTEAKILIEKLHFKADETKKLLEGASPETKEKFEIGEVATQAGYSLEDVKQLIEKDKRESENQILAENEISQNQIIEILPKNIPVKITNYTPTNIYKPPRKHLEKTGKSEELEINVEDNFDEEAVYSKNDIDKIEVGSWGEEYIFNALKEKYKGKIEETSFGVEITDDAQRKIEIYNLNKEGLGIGCDFEIKIDGEIVEIIEAKSKKEANPIFIRMSGEQWNRAKKEREKYWIYVFVYNEQKTSAEIIPIQDPATKWEKGELSAQVVEIKISRDK